MRTVLIVTQPSKKPIVYGSVVAMLEDPANPISISDRTFRTLQKSGFPIEHSGCRIDQADFVSSGDARNRANQ
jgi:hypothetical protein